jgi:hypothetical protein
MSRVSAKLGQEPAYDKSLEYRFGKIGAAHFITFVIGVSAKLGQEPAYDKSLEYWFGKLGAAHFITFVIGVSRSLDRSQPTTRASRTAKQDS